MFLTDKHVDKHNNGSKRIVQHDYHDHSTEIYPSPSTSGASTATDPADAVPPPPQEQDSSKSSNSNNAVRRGPRGGVAVPFPEKLHLMLESIEKDGYSGIVSWQPHGRCFVVKAPKEFVSTVMPTYFRQTKLTSFQRQLNLYGFCRLTSGKDRGGYYHELFLRGRPFLCKKMTRTRIKGTGIKAASSPNTEPDFYTMPPVRDLSESSSSLEEMNSIHHLQQQPANIVTPPAQVTPIHMPLASVGPELPLLSAEYDPVPNSLIEFEGQQFHYLDPTSFFAPRDEASTSANTESPCCQEVVMI